MTAKIQLAPLNCDFGPFHLDADEGVLLRAGQPVALTPKAFETLLALLERRGHLVTKEELMQRIWPGTYVEEVNLAKNISDLRRVLAEGDAAHEYIQTVSRRGYRFIAGVTAAHGAQALNEHELSSARALSEWWEPVGGALPLDSPFYIARPADAELRAVIARRDGTVLVKGPRQVGKTSLLARGLQQARQAGVKVVLTDLQRLNAADLISTEACLLALAEFIAARLTPGLQPRQVWDALHSANFNFEQFWYEVLARLDEPVVWALDEVDRLFGCSFAGEIFGLFRSWHNARALEPDGPWTRLTLILAYATEAHLFITDLNQSPFNVGTRLLLEDFTLEQVAELNRRYGAPLRAAEELAAFFALVGGNPYLAQRGLHELRQRGLTLRELEAEAAEATGPFGDHLRRILTALAQDEALCAGLRGVLRGQAQLDAESFYRLKSAGVLSGAAAQQAQLRCRLYADYLARHLL